MNRLVNKWHSTAPGVKASIAIFFANLITKGISYLTSPIFTRILTTEEYGLSKAKRPFNSRLDKSKLIRNGFKPLPDWKDALRRYLELYKGE